MLLLPSAQRGSLLGSRDARRRNRFLRGAAHHRRWVSVGTHAFLQERIAGGFDSFPDRVSPRERIRRGDDGGVADLHVGDDRVVPFLVHPIARANKRE
jgi:hypothetical protein